MGSAFAVTWLQGQGRALMILFHGTSRSRAARIREFGFEYPDFKSEIEEISRRYEVRSIVLEEKLRKLGRIVSARHDDKRIYFSSHLMHAASYATRAPEFYWEALWAVYAIRNPEIGSHWNKSDEGHAWVLSQMQSDPPVILHVEISEDVLGQDAERIRGIRKIMPPNSESGGTQVGLVPSSNLQIVDLTASDYWIDASLLRFLAGLSADEIHAQVLAGVWGQSFYYQFTKCWMWNDIKARLRPERLRELNLV